MRYLCALLCLAASAFAQGIVLERIVMDPPPETRRPPWPVRLVEHRVKISIEDQAAATEVVQVFHNPNPWPMEGVYLFPLPENASVSRFVMRMGDKEVPGEIVDADRAREIYLSIVHRRRDPGLLEYAGRRCLRARIFPIPGRGETKITLRLEQLLEPVGGMVELVYPLRSDRFSETPVNVSGEIDVRDRAGVATLFSPTHKLDVVQKDATHAVASFEENRARPDRDLRVLYGRGRKDLGFGLASHKPAGEDGTFLMLLSPNAGFDDARVLPKDIVFVLDTSGSMGDRGGRKMEQAKAALTYALGRLKPQDRFNVIAFATEARPFRDGAVEATKDNVEAALAYVAKLEATGGTAIHDALVEALKLPRADGRMPIVLFLTDGEPTIGPTEPEVILKAVAASNGANARLFVFGVGDDVNATLLAELAARNRGTGHFVSEGENIEVKVSALVDKVAAPVLTDVEIVVEGLGEYDVYPRRPGDLFKGQQVSVLGRYRTAGPRAVRLKGRLGDKAVEYVYEGTFAAGPDREYLPRLWAVRKVGFLLAEIQRNGEQRELVDDVKRLATRYGIVTPYTSFLVVEEQEMLRRREAQLRGRFGLGGGAGGEPADAAPAEEAIRSLREALDDAEAEGADMGRAGGALKSGAPAGPGAVAAAKRAAELMGDREDGPVRTLGVKTVDGKTFRFVDGVWTDGEAVPAGTPVKRVTYLGDAWAALLADAKLARYLSVGSRVRVLHQGTLYEVVEE